MIEACRDKTGKEPAKVLKYSFLSCLLKCTLTEKSKKIICSSTCFILRLLQNNLDWEMRERERWERQRDTEREGERERCVRERETERDREWNKMQLACIQRLKDLPENFSCRHYQCLRWSQRCLTCETPGPEEQAQLESSCLRKNWPTVLWGCSWTSLGWLFGCEALWTAPSFI